MEVNRSSLGLILVIMEPLVLVGCCLIVIRECLHIFIAFQVKQDLITFNIKKIVGHDLRKKEFEEHRLLY